MTLREELTSLTPRLRRYARALTTGNAAPSAVADDIVHATLMRALGARQLGSSSDLIIRLYATVTQLHRDTVIAGRQARVAGGGRPDLVVAGPNFRPARPTKLSAALVNLPIEEREVVLLVGLEGFNYTEASRILRISRNVLLTRLTQGRTSLDKAINDGLPVPARRRVPYLRLVT